MPIQTLSLKHPVECFVALPAEARPLLDYFKLRQVHSQPFKHYQREHFHLTVTGIGKLAAASAVAWRLGQTNDTTHTSVLNVGVAGAGSAQLGSLQLVHSVLDVGSQKRWHPSLIVGSRLSTQALHCHDQPVRDYPKQALVDMESAGIWAAATAFQSLELIQSLKVVSDNPEQPLDALDIKALPRLLSEHLPQVALIAQGLSELADNLPHYGELQALQHELTKRYCLSQTQTRQLRRLLERLDSLGIAPDSLQRDLPSTLRSSRDLLTHLAGQLP